jgi:lactase-phlorizin hydrolase
VKSWITLNEPWVIAHMGYGTAEAAPRIKGNGVLDYIAGHNLIKAHAKAWHIYDDNFRATQKGNEKFCSNVMVRIETITIGEVGITLNSGWYEPKTQSQQDIEAAERSVQFYVVNNFTPLHKT